MHLLLSVFQNWFVDNLVVVLVRTRLHLTVLVWETREHHLMYELFAYRIAMSFLTRHVQKVRPSLVHHIMVA